MAEPTTPAPAADGGGRRRAPERARRAPSPVALAAVVIPLLTLGVLALVRPADEPALTRPAQEVELTRSTVVCAPALAAPDRVLVALSDTVADASVGLRAGGDESEVAVDGTTVTRRSRPATSLVADGEAARALVATRTGAGRVSQCVDPAPRAWFTGVAAGAEHASTLVLTNPDRGPAVADVFVLGPDGPREVPALRGVRVGGGRTTELDLAEVVPTQDVLALQVVVTRGRLGSHVVDSVDPLGRAPRAEQWLPGQDEPREVSWITGLGGKPARRVLSVANPSDSAVRVDLRLITPQSEFAPAGLDELDVAAGSVVEVDLTRTLRGRAARGAVGLRLDATGPVTAALRSSTADGIALSVPGPAVAERAVAALPRGAKRLVVAGASAPGTLTWRVRDAAGSWSESERLEIDPGRALRFALPRDGQLVEVLVERAEVVASVEVGPPGLAVMPLRDQVTSALVPDVRPGLR